MSLVLTFYLIVPSNFYQVTRPEVSEAGPRVPKGNETRGIKVDTRKQKFKSQHVSLIKQSISEQDQRSQKVTHERHNSVKM